MFHLEERVARWRERLDGMASLRSSDIEELEQHVRDSIASLTASGLSDEEAFIIATHRIGEPDVLAREFAYVNRGHMWSQRMFWMVAGVVGYLGCRLVIGAIASLGGLAVFRAGGDGVSIGYAAATVTCLGWALVAVWLYRVRNADSPKPLFLKFSTSMISLGVTGILMLAVLARFASDRLLVQFLPMPELGHAMAIPSAANAVLAVLIPLILLVVMLANGRQRPEIRPHARDSW